MRAIPLKTRREIKKDNWYLQCCLRPFTDCRHHPKIDIHHGVIYEGHQIDDLWNLIPLCRTCHDDISKPHIKEFVDWIMFSRASDEELEQISQAIKYVNVKYSLINIYGDYIKILKEKGERVPIS